MFSWYEYLANIVTSTNITSIHLISDILSYFQHFRELFFILLYIFHEYSKACRLFIFILKLYWNFRKTISIFLSRLQSDTFIFSLFCALSTKNMIRAGLALLWIWCLKTNNQNVWYVCLFAVSFMRWVFSVDSRWTSRRFGWFCSPWQYRFWASPAISPTNSFTRFSL